jgi:hypothetical protein
LRGSRSELLLHASGFALDNKDHFRDNALAFAPIDNPC